MKGFIEIKKTFSDSKLKIESEKASFVSTEFSGDLSGFEVKGYLTQEGETNLVTLKGQYFGMVDSDMGHKKTAFKLTNENLTMGIFASRPSESTTALYKEVAEIVEYVE